MVMDLDRLDCAGQAELAARAFVAQYPEAYGLILKWARADVDAGRKPSMHLYLALLRRFDWIHRGKRPYRVNNNWSRPLVEIVTADFPDLGARFERRGGEA